MKLTGRSRYAHYKSFLGTPKLVLQVEEEFLHTENCGTYVDSRTAVRWRDATVADLSEWMVKDMTRKD